MTRRLRTPVIVVALVLVVVAVWVITVGGVQRADRPSVAAHRAELVTEARLAAASVNAWIIDARAEMAATANRLGPWTGSGAQVAGSRATLDAALAVAPNVDGGFIVVDQRGRVAVASSGLAAIESQTRRSAAVTAALAGKPALTDVIEDPLLHVVWVGVAEPLHDARGGVTGALVGFTRLPDGALVKTIAATEQTLGHPLDVVTAGGTVMSGSSATPSPNVPKPSIERVDGTTRAPREAAARDGHDGLLAYEGEGRVETVAGYAPIADGWLAVLPRPASALGVTGHRATRAAGLVIGLILAAALAIILALLALLRERSTNVEEVKQSFLAIAGHELRTPLTVIKGFTDLLVTRWDRVPDESRQNIIETISFQVRNLEHLVERLLLGAQLEAGMTPSIAHEAVELAPFLENVAKQQRAVAPTHDFVVTAPEGLDAWADRKALGTVLTNLVENAVKYSPDGGTVTLSARETRGRALITVDDEGIGLPADLDAIFEKFVQREAVDTRVHDEGGVGLGLYIVRTLVTNMGGSVRAERRDPEGARLIVTLPRPADATGRRRRFRLREPKVPAPS